MPTAAPCAGFLQPLQPSHHHNQQQQQQQQYFWHPHASTSAPSYAAASTGFAVDGSNGSSSNSSTHSGGVPGDSGLLLALANEVGNPGCSPVNVLRGSNGTCAVVSYITRRPNSSSSSSSSGGGWGSEPWRVDVWNGRAWQNIGLFPDQTAAAAAASYALALVAGGSQ
jgi:hypothetical protein